MEFPQAPLTWALYLAAAVLTALGTALPRERGRVPAFFGGLLWCFGTVRALVEGASLDAALCVTLALLLISTGFRKRGAGKDEL